VFSKQQTPHTDIFLSAYLAWQNKKFLKCWIGTSCWL